MGLSSKKTKTTQTTTPTVTEPYNAAFQGFTNQIGDFLATDPTQYVAPASELQTQAFQQAQNLGGWQPYIDQASDYANSYANAPATTIDAVGYNAPNVPDPYMFGGAQLSPAWTYGGAQLGDAAQAQGAQLNDPKRLLEFMDDYRNPYTQQVIDASLSKFDEDAGRREAALSAQGAQTGAFGGSRFGIAEGTLQGTLARERADMQARLYDEQFKTAASLAGVDAASANQYGLAQGSLDQQTQLANQDAMNSFMMQQGLLDQQTGQMNMDALNQFAMQQGLLDQQTGAMNMDALNNFLITQVGLDADSARYYADAMNQANFANAQLLEQSYNRDFQAAGLMGDLGQQYGQQSLADLGMTAQLGEMQRGIASEYTNAVPTQLQMAGNLYSQLYPGIYSGSNMTGTQKTSGLGSWLPQVVGAGMQAAGTAAAGGAFSDRRLKSNIVKVGEFQDGLGEYEYDIFGQRQRGVMADEVAELRPWALGPVVSGYATVDYGKL